MPKGNVLFVTLDQWRGDCLSAGGHPVLRTPNLDRLASRGVRFTSHWANAAPCGPSRACLYTGTYLTTNRVVVNGTPLDDRLVNVARLATIAGYRPTLFGYTDTVVSPDTARVAGAPPSPADDVLPGFAVGSYQSTDDPSSWARWLTAKGIDVPAQPYDLYRPDTSFPGATRHLSGWAPNHIPAEATETAFLVERFGDWLNRQEEPWFGHLSLIAAHPPYTASPGYHDRYSADDGPPFRRHPDRDAERAVHPIAAIGVDALGCPIEEADARQLRATYWGKMAEVDDQMGRLVDGLEAVGHLSDTLIIVTSDHGDQLGDHWMTQKLAWYPESYSVPLIVSDPRPESDVSRGSAVEAVTEHVDLLPTICEWMGVDVPRQCDGRSLLPFLHGPAPACWRVDAHWQWDVRSLLGREPSSRGWPVEHCGMDVVRTPEAVYAHLGDGSCLLFDRSVDPDHLEDATRRPGAQDMLADVRARLLTWRLATGRDTLLSTP